MSKKEKKNKSKTGDHKKIKNAVKVFYNDPSGNLFKYLKFVPLILTAAAGIYFIMKAFAANGFLGFPLDDPWIHLTFAKNLVEYGSFSYFKNEMIVSGSTSPVYTLLLSLFYLISSNEYVISYIIGISAGILMIFMMLKISAEHFKVTGLLTLLTVTLISLSPKINIINVSGMETSLFMFFIAASLYFYHTRNFLLLGIFAGLTIWCRPDGFVLWIAIAIDYSLRRFYFSGDKSNDLALKDIRNSFLIALLFAAAYFVFNYLLSGSFMPSTYSAKTEFYQNSDRAGFLMNEVIGFFNQGEFLMIWIPFLIGAAGIIVSFIKKERNVFLVYLLFIVGLIAVYYLKLPFAHRFGRYLIPVIPFYILIAVSGIKIILDFIVRYSTKGNNLPATVLVLIFAAIAVTLFINENKKSAEEYALLCKYHNQRHVAAGMWIKENTEENSIIATHDIGAIGFYGERRIIDMAGLVTPELTEHINNKNYTEYLNKYISMNNVDYIAALRNWFEIVNDEPVFMPVNEFEIMEIFKYDPERTHIQPREVSQLNQAAIQSLQNGNAYQALNYLNMSIKLDNRSSQTHYLLGLAYRNMKDEQKAEQHFIRAGELNPNLRN